MDKLWNIELVVWHHVQPCFPVMPFLPGHCAYPHQAVNLVHIALVRTCEDMAFAVQAVIELLHRVCRVLGQLAAMHGDVWFSNLAAHTVALAVAAAAPAFTRVPRAQFWMSRP